MSEGQEYPNRRGKRTPDPQTRGPWREATGQKSVFVLPKQTSGPWPPMDFREGRERVKSLLINVLQFFKSVKPRGG